MKTSLYFVKALPEKKNYAFNVVFRVDVNDVKPFQNHAGWLPADHFHDPQFLPRLFKTKKRFSIQILLFFTMFQQFTTGVMLVTRIPA